MTGRRAAKALRALLVACAVSGVTPVAWAQSDEERVGDAAAARILGVAPLVEAGPAQRYVGLVGAAVTARVQGSYRWRFGLVRSDAVNAFAAPGGIILVTTGLVRQLQNEDELAFVLAHEVAHVMRQHHYRVVVRQRLAQAAAQALQATGQGPADPNLSQASAQMYARGLDKEAEFEADRLGVELATRAGFDSAAALGVLERLRAIKGDDPRAQLLFATHPAPGERLDRLLQSGIDALPRPASEAVAQRQSRFRQFLASL